MGTETRWCHHFLVGRNIECGPQNKRQGGVGYDIMAIAHPYPTSCVEPIRKGPSATQFNLPSYASCAHAEATDYETCEATPDTVQANYGSPANYICLCLSQERNILDTALEYISGMYRGRVLP